MTKKAIFYLHGFNSASQDLHGQLLICKDKLKVLQDYCQRKNILLYSPNVDYRDFNDIVEDILIEWNQLLDRYYDVVFMGSSMGGFSSEYLAMKTGGRAIMINPAVSPSSLLPQFIGVDVNYETGQPYEWQQSHCDQYVHYEQELANNQKPLQLIILLDMADELIDASLTVDKYRTIAQIHTYDGGSHSFEHMKEALPVIDQLIFPG